jgi:predicted ATPase
MLETLPETPERARREIPLQVTLGMQLQVSKGFAAPEVERIYARARALYEQKPETAALFPVLWGLWMFHEVGGEPRKSWELAERLFTLARKADDPAQLIQARQALAITSLCRGDPAATHEHMEHGIALYDAERHSNLGYLYGQDPGVGCLAFGAVALWLLGRPDQAVARSREAVALAGASGQPSTLALALHFAAIVRQHRREAPAVQECAEAIMTIAIEHGFSFWRAGALIMRGWALAEQGAGASAIAELRQGFADLIATGARTYGTYYLALLAEALGKQGQIDEGLRLLAEALAWMNDTGEGFRGSELHRLQGELLLLRASAGETCRAAEACFRRARTLARHQQARSFELRAAISLTRLYQRQDRAAEARPILAGCYKGFTEGLDTADLREARALLDGAC